VDNVGAQAGQAEGLAQTQRHRRGRRQPSGADDGHSVLLPDRGARAGVADQDGHPVARPNLGLRQDLDVVLNPAQDGGVVFVEVEDVHADCRLLIADC
jgi:hypothetical protein